LQSIRTVIRDQPQLLIGRCLALALAVTGLGSVVSVVVPQRVGNVDWEVGAIGEVAATAALPVMGLAAVIAISMFERRRWAVVISAVLMMGLGGLSLFGLVLLGTDSPIVLEAASNAEASAAVSVRLVLVKSLTLLLLFTVGLFGLGIVALRSVRRSK